MKTVRKLRAVPDCPMPEPPKFKPVVYGAAPWSRLPHTPPAHEITIRARALIENFKREHPSCQ